MNNNKYFFHKQNADMDLKALNQGGKQYNSKEQMSTFYNVSTQNNLITKP